MDLDAYVAAISETNTYREFLLHLYKSIKAKDKSFSYAYIARIAGFKSRSYPREVLQGSRRITAASFFGFQKAFRFAGDRGEYFRLLVAKEEEDVRLQGETLDSIAKKMKSIEARLKFHNSNPEVNDAESFKNYDLPIIFAALGTMEKGATYHEISGRTGLDREKIESTLKWLVDENFVSFAKGRYYPANLHQIGAKLGDSQFFKFYFLKVLKDTEREAMRRFDNSENFFFCSSLSVSRKNMAKIKRQLQDRLSSYIDLVEEPDGDTILQVMSSASLITKKGSNQQFE